MWKTLLLLGLFGVLLARPLVQATAQMTGAPAEYLCTADTLNGTPSADNLSEGSHLVTLTWTGNASAIYLWFQVYVSQTSGGPYTLLADCIPPKSYGTQTGVATQDGTLYYGSVVTGSYQVVENPNQTFYYVVTSVTIPTPQYGVMAYGAESVSGTSTQATAVIPLFDTLSVPDEAQSASLMESLGTWDNIFYSGVATGTLNETLATSDSITASQPSGATAQIHETLSTADSLSAKATLLTALAESLSTSDSLAPLLHAPLQFTEALSTTDVLGAAGTFVSPAGLAETLALTDSLGAEFNGNISQNETLTTVDALTVISSQFSALSETLSTSDSLTPVHGHQVALSQSLSGMDTLAANTSLGAGLAESLTTIDAVNVSFGAGASLSEILSTLDALTQVPGFQQALAESLSASDAIAPVHGHRVTLAESLSTSDALAPSAGFVVALQESLSHSSAISVAFSGGIGMGETLHTSDALGATSAQASVLTETLTTSDALGALLTAHSEVLAENLFTTDLIYATGSYSLGMGEQLTTLDAITITGQPPGQIQSNIAIFLLGNYGIAPAGSCGFDLSIFGWGFNALSVANWNGGPQPTVFVSPNMLTMTVSAADLNSAGEFPITVKNPGTGVSSKKVFSVLSATPTIATATVKGAVIAVAGASFVPTSTIFWNGLPLSTTFISQTSLQAVTPLGVKAIGSNLVTVIDTGCFVIP